MAVVLAKNTTPQFMQATQPGYFTGVYSGSANSPFTKKAQLELVARRAFTEELKEKNKSNQVVPLQAKIKNVSYALPLTGGIMQEVGPYGLIWGRLDLCQYYKKSNPY